MITHISEKETQLVSMLRKTGEALDACTAERDAFKDTLQDVRGHYERVCTERDTYQVEADKLAMECKVLRDALESILSHETIGNMGRLNAARAALGVSL
jgi:hypothetical protein